MKEYIVRVYDNSVQWRNKDGQLHREDGPAITYTTGNIIEEWYFNGKPHRLDGPAVTYRNGTKFWYKENCLHRKDGPAKEYSNGTKYWFFEDKLHREDGPAVEYKSYKSGDKIWFLNGKEYSKEEYKIKMNPISTCDGKVVEIDGIKYKLTKV